MMTRAWAAVFLAVSALPFPPANAQPFEAGPPGTIVGSSMSGARVGGAPTLGQRRIEGAPVFGDTVEERRWGRDYDDSHLRPKVPRTRGSAPIELRAREGSPALDPLNSGVFSRSGPDVISRSGVTRPALGGRAKIVGGRAKIRR